MILHNGHIVTIPDFSEKIFEKGLSLYEVIRIFNGKPIFLKDNLLRLQNSLNKSNIRIRVENLNIPDKLNRFIQLNDMTAGNLKYVLYLGDTSAEEYIYQIPHAYPTAQDYKDGVATMTCTAVRENPGVKYINTDLRTRTNQLIQAHQVYEVLLVDHEEFITEGSRSNVFFIKDRKLYTSPLAYVLPGTSRKRVFDICKEHHYPIEEMRIAVTELTSYQAAFLSGTSPLILPINRIDEITFDPQLPFLQTLMKHYFALLTENS